jgi:GNAT superfamily N-acetyltransferase
VTFREAQKADIPQMMEVRMSVKENVLSNPALVTQEDCFEYLFVRGKGWVCEVGEIITGFAIADLKDNNIWALFVRPGYEKMGIGRQLHKVMLDWYFSQTTQKVWLGTAPKSRAEQFYKTAGWKEVGIHGKGEIKFEMRFEDWNK